uniref:Apple domain-containing protein n=1 Tax=Alexandrium catenella TaxID=2925 RepID=A0A7S1PRJ8_ALECA
MRAAARPRNRTAEASRAAAECVERNTVLRHAGEHGIFVDASLYAHSGCFQNDCGMTDKFRAADLGVCGRACSELEECTHWSFGYQDGMTKCFLRKSDGGRETLMGSFSGGKACAPAPLPAAFVALATAESPGVRACDGGKTEKCRDVHAAVTTWRFAISFLKKAVEGRVDEGTWGTIEQIGRDSDNLLASITGEYRPSDADFDRVVFNNRLIFNSLRDWLDQFPKAELSTADATLPLPLRYGRLCGKQSCYEL